MLLLFSTTTPESTSGAFDLLGPMLIVVGVILVSVLIVISIRAKIARRKAATPSPRQRLDEIKSAQSRSDDFHSGMSQLYETSQRLAAQLDNKSERLIRITDRAETVLHQLQDVLQRLPDDATIETSSKHTQPPDPLAAEVYALADEGHDPIKIAQQLDEQIGKVELILALRQSAPRP